MTGRLSVDSLHIALIYSGLGDVGEMLEWLEKGDAERSSAMISLNPNPRYARRRGNLIFKNLLRRIGFAV